jgi:hypothetical protein
MDEIKSIAVLSNAISKKEYCSNRYVQNLKKKPVSRLHLIFPLLAPRLQIQIMNMLYSWNRQKAALHSRVF